MDDKDKLHQYNLIKEITSLAYQDEYDMENFITYFFVSKIFKQIIDYSDITYFNPRLVYLRFVKEVDIKKGDQNPDILVLYYVVNIYLKFYYRTSTSFSAIMSQLPYKDIIDFYELYHTLSEERVIFMSKIRYNLKMNAIRKKRSKKNVELSFNDRDYNLYIAKQLYVKLFSYPEIYSSKYVYNNKHRYLINDNLFFLYTCYLDEIHSVLNDEELAHIKYMNTNNVLFIFPKNGEVLTKDELQSLFMAQKGVAFDKILVYQYGKILFINWSDGYKEFYVDINLLDERRIKSGYLLRYSSTLLKM